MIILRSVTLALAISCISHVGAATIEVGDLVLAPDGSGHLDVRVLGAGESTNLAGYEFRITPDAGTTSQLRFVEESESFLAASDYLFGALSAAAGDGLASSVGVVSTTSLPSDTFVGGDSTDDFSDVAVTSNLLIRLSVLHDIGPADPATTLGHTFSVALVPASGDSNDFANGLSNTGFADSNFDVLAFDSSPGTVSIVIPEPNCLGLLTLLAIAGTNAIRGERSL